MPSGKPPLLSHIEEIKKQITALSADITEIKSLLIKYSQEEILVEKPDVPFPQKSQSQQSVEKGWFW
jgi:hypothetical protein